MTDILMASSAIPVLFPPQVINSVLDQPLKIKEGTYFEGAQNGLFFNFRKQLKKIVESHGVIEELFVVSPQRSIEPVLDIHHNLSGMTYEEREAFQQYMNRISFKHFLEFLLDLNAANEKHKIAQ
ncbi:MAG: hypothetical protein JXR22_04270, partial [Prolixibacteraceae bacterium]|nr:hypothetical protein [Prolixibacteraceae bacterium]